MFKYQVLLFAFLACAFADKEQVPIVAYESSVEPDGGFHYNFETGDGTKAEATGELKTIDKETAGVIKGAFSYQGDDGKSYSINYVADENGYQPQGEHIPQIPAAIKKALEFLATAPPPKE